MRNLLIAVAALALAACSTNQDGDTVVDHDRDPSTPQLVVTAEEKCTGHLTVIAAFEVLTEDGHQLSRLEQIGYNFALAGKRRNCPGDLTPEAAEERVEAAEGDNREWGSSGP